MTRLLLFALLAACVGEPPCRSDGECTLPAVCAQGRCAAPEPAADGTVCSHDAHCAGGACVNAVCATACAQVMSCDSARCTPIADGSRLRFVCGVAAGDRLLAEPCVTDAECRSGFCHDLHCSSPCGACPGLQSCRPATVTRGPATVDVGVCTWWPVQPTLELGGFDVPATGTAHTTFELPPHFGAFTLLLEDFDGRVPVISRLVGPGDLLFVGNPADGGVRDLTRASQGRGQATVLVPGTDEARGRPPAGTWRVEFALFDPMNFPATQRQLEGRVDRVAVVLKQPEPGGLVDLTLQVAPETGYALDGGFVTTMLQSFDALLRDKVGAALGQVSIRSLPTDAGVSITSSAQGNALWANTTLDTKGARPVNLLLVRTLSFAGGISGGVPGPPGVYGRPGSGVIVAPLASGPTTTAVLAGHEVLHYLGLSHTSDEFRGPDFISDTPSCPNPNTAGCPDERNLMFPFFPTREPLTVTPGQRRVLEGSPWLTHPVHPRGCGEADVFGVSRTGFATATTASKPARLQASCGGAGPEQVHLVRLERQANLDVRVAGTGFTPVVSVRRASCEGPEVACAAADGGTASVRVDNAEPGAWFVVVDSVADGGIYRLDVTTP